MYQNESFTVMHISRVLGRKFLIHLCCQHCARNYYMPSWEVGVMIMALHPSHCEERPIFATFSQAG